MKVTRWCLHLGLRQPHLNHERSRWVRSRFAVYSPPGLGPQIAAYVLQVCMEGIAISSRTTLVLASATTSVQTSNNSLEKPEVIAALVVVLVVVLIGLSYVGETSRG